MMAAIRYAHGTGVACPALQSASSIRARGPVDMRSRLQRAPPFACGGERAEKLVPRRGASGGIDPERRCLGGARLVCELCEFPAGIVVTTLVALLRARAGMARAVRLVT
jgi:hypothetical protein